MLRMLPNMTIINNPTNCLCRSCWSLKISGSVKLQQLSEGQCRQLFSQSRVLVPDQVWEDTYIHVAFTRAYDTDFMGDRVIWHTERVVWTDNAWGSKTPAGLKANLLLFLSINQPKEFVSEQCSAIYWLQHSGSVPKVFLKPDLLYYQATLWKINNK